jgi:DNA-binding NtrC family response regulator
MTTYTAATGRTASMEPLRSDGEYLPGPRAGRTDALLRTARVAIVASSDRPLSQRLARSLEELRWVVRLAAGGAEAMAHLDAHFDLQAGEAALLPSTLLVDSWLPDLEVRELVRELGELYPDLDVMSMDGTDLGAAAARGTYRHEVLLALRAAQASDEAAWTLAPTEESILGGAVRHSSRQTEASPKTPAMRDSRSAAFGSADRSQSASVQFPVEHPVERPVRFPVRHPARLPVGSAAALADDASLRVAPVPLPEFIGSSQAMLEVSRRIRLVAPRTTSVLIEGATGTGKELVARALHRLSPRASRSLVALNCAAIPEALLESELFGHTRGAFTGASQARVGRIEAAHGGTLFLDEIGELPLALQAKLLRFLECGELQRVGDNEPVRVDVRVVAATHRGLSSMVRDGRFRADLFYRLSVFLIHTPSLCEHAADVPVLVEYFLERMSRTEPAKRLSAEALGTLMAHSWPGNVRELEHVLERAWILAEDRPVIGTEEIELGEQLP